MDSERDFLKSYDITKYDRPSVTTDVVALTIRSEETDNYRTDEQHDLSVLLVKRGAHPFKGRWALPGGFLQKSETVEQCAVRETREETSVTPTALMPVGIFSTPGRDPRGWIVSCAFISVLGAEDIRQKGGDDADEAQWFTIGFRQTDENTFELRLSHGEEEIRAVLCETGSRFGKTEFEIKDSGGLAFDHAGIIATALTSLKEAAKDMNITFDFLPEKFTLTELQRVQEAITNASVFTANFRRKISGLVEETDEFRSGAGHRPARLYRRRKM